MSLIGKKAPLFKASAVIDGSKIENNFTLEQYIGQKEVVLFFYPKDFTYICPTEIISFEEYLEDFYDRGVMVVGCSTDTEETHLAWLNTPIEKGGIKGVTFPLIADNSKTISSNFGVLGGSWDYNNEGELNFSGNPIAYRGTFFIDKEGIVRHETINDLSLGRNVEEILRVIDMWHHTKQYGEVCPANWSRGKRALEPSHEGVKQYLVSYLQDTKDSYTNYGCDISVDTMVDQGGGCCGGSGSCSKGDDCCSKKEENQGCCSK